MKSVFKPKTIPVRESFTGYEMDLLALWLRGSISSNDPDLLRMLASMDADRHLLYREMHAELHPKVSTLLESTQSGPTMAKAAFIRSRIGRGAK